MVEKKIKSELRKFLGLAEQVEEEKEKEERSKNPLVNGEPNVIPKYGEKRMSLVIEGMQEGVERYYYWVLRYVQAEGFFGKGYDKIYKVKDLFKAGEASSFFGSVEQRKMNIQDKVSQYLKGISEMTKALFQIIRELRIIDERRGYYIESKKGGEEAESAEIALKSIWVDMVEGGAKNPSSIYGLAREVGFVTLPDFFYQVNPKKGKDGVKEAVKALDVNKKVKEVLQRKLFQYYNWKEKTEIEIENRRKFMLKYLRQHYSSIRLYISWVRPYLETIRRLQTGATMSDADIAAAFDTSKVEIEFLATRGEFEEYLPVLRFKFKFVAIPQMAYHQEYQRGAIHMGRTDILIEPYVVSKKELDSYLNKKDEEDIELIGSLNDAMKAVGDELKAYLKEADEKIPEDEEKEEEKEVEGILSPFIALKDGFKELFDFSGGKKEKKLKGGGLSEKEDAEKAVKADAWTVYDVFKKAHKMITP